MAFYVSDEFRENPLSFRPGGYDVEIFYRGKSSRIYTKVKAPYKFWKKAKEENPDVKNFKVLGPSKDY